MSKALLLVVLGLFAISVSARVVSGTAGNDNLFGTSATDDIYGFQGDDTINALNGDDNVWGGPGNDNVDGKAGNDIIFGDEGDDTTVFGNDDLSGGDGNDRLYGDEGDDTLRGDAGDDYLDGGEGNDNLNAGSGNDVVHGGPGNDVITQDGGAGSIFPGDGDDTIQINDCDPGTEITLGEGINTIRFGPRFGGNIVIQKFSHNDVLYSTNCDLTYDVQDFTTIRTKQGGSIKLNGNGVSSKQIFMDRCSCGSGSDCVFNGQNPTTSTSTTGTTTTTTTSTTGTSTTSTSTTGTSTTTGTTTTTGATTTTGGITSATTTTGIVITGATTTGTGVITPTVCASTQALSQSFEAAPPLCQTQALPYTGIDAAAVRLGLTRFVIETAGVSAGVGRLNLRVRLVSTTDFNCGNAGANRVAFNGAGNNVQSCALAAPTLRGYFRAQRTGALYTFTMRPNSGNNYYNFDTNVAADYNAFLAENNIPTPANRNDFLIGLFGRQADATTPGPVGSADLLGCDCNLGITPSGNINGVITLVNEVNGECHSFYVWQAIASNNRNNRQISSRPFSPCCVGCNVLP